MRRLLLCLQGRSWGEGVSECEWNGGRERDVQGKENKDLCPDACGVVVGVDAECIEGGEDDEDGCPAVV
jgi:hypothetical protein